MTTKQFVLTLVVAAAICLSFVVGGHAQNAAPGFILLNAQTSVAGCAWPTTFATVTNGVAVCPLNINGVPGLAIGLNGGAFIQVGSGTTYTATTPVVVTGTVISCPTCVTSAVTSLNGHTGALNLSATATAPTVTVTAQ